MKTILNHSDHDFDFPQTAGQAAVVRDTMVKIKRSRMVNEAKVPGSCNVDDATLKAMKAHPVTKAWFRDGGLSVADDVDEEAPMAPPPPAKQPEPKQPESTKAA